MQAEYDQIRKKFHAQPRALLPRDGADAIIERFIALR